MGDIPFTEAWIEGVKYPKFDSQEVVLNGVVSLLDEALNEINLDDPWPLLITIFFIKVICKSGFGWPNL